MKINRVTSHILAVLFLLSLDFQTQLQAEPATSQAHIRLLWGFSLIGAFLISRIPFLLRKRIQPRRGAWVFWIAAVLAGGFFLLVVGPIIVALGSILITGRTM